MNPFGLNNPKIESYGPNQLHDEDFLKYFLNKNVFVFKIIKDHNFQSKLHWTQQARYLNVSHKSTLTFLKS